MAEEENAMTEEKREATSRRSTGDKQTEELDSDIEVLSHPEQGGREITKREQDREREMAGEGLTGRASEAKVDREREMERDGKREEEKEEAVDQLMLLTGLGKVEAELQLEASEWNIQQAAESFFLQQERENTSIPSLSSSVLRQRSRPRAAEGDERREDKEEETTDSEEREREAKRGKDKAGAGKKAKKAETANKPTRKRKLPPSSLSPSPLKQQHITSFFGSRSSPPPVSSPLSLSSSNSSPSFTLSLGETQLKFKEDRRDGRREREERETPQKMGDRTDKGKEKREGRLKPQALFTISEEREKPETSLSLQERGNMGEEAQEIKSEEGETQAGKGEEIAVPPLRSSFSERESAPVAFSSLSSPQTAPLLSPEKREAKREKADGEGEKERKEQMERGVEEESARGELDFQLPLQKFDPLKGWNDWKVGERAPFACLTAAFDLLLGTTKRLSITLILTNLFRTLIARSPEDVLPAVLLCANAAIPQQSGIGGSLISAAIREATGASATHLRNLYREMGDIGDVAAACKQSQSTISSFSLPSGKTRGNGAKGPLGIGHVVETMEKIAKEKGQGSNERKKKMIVGLLRACQPQETKYLVRALVAHLRIGATVLSSLYALARAVTYHRLEQDAKASGSPRIPLLPQQVEALLSKAQESVKESFSLSPSLFLVVPPMLEGGVELLAQRSQPTVGVPIKPMCGKICSGYEELFKTFKNQPFLCEYKYDGQRAQIHGRRDGQVSVYSRQLDETTEKWADIHSIILESLSPGTMSFVVDAELVAVDRRDKEKPPVILPFQTLSNRPKKMREGEGTDITVCAFLFDLMVLNDEPLLTAPFRERRKKLMEAFKPVDGCLTFTTSLEASAIGPSSSSLSSLPSTSPTPSSSLTEEKEEKSEEETEMLVSSFLTESIENNCEGLMCKLLDGPQSSYEADKRTGSWLKLKKDYLATLHESIDLVPIGAWYGNGRKAGWFSPFLLAAYNREKGELESVCRCMSGFTDEFYKRKTEEYKTKISDKQKSYVITNETPSVWFEPCEVWEIRGADYTLSPVHMAGAGMADRKRGISVRFPRFIRERPDKSIEDATSSEELVELFRKQSR